MTERTNKLHVTNRELEVLNDLINQELEGLAEHEIDVDPALDSLAFKVTAMQVYIRSLEKGDN